ncbi:NAD-dependent succinate-semialdehyde dehydrogenase [Paraburkholderia caballeronis]|uniref:Succinate semialdehyde dehydrogenase n=1 Tax=Paraburkholderia caballeronis TaxID=416943 RepID=A0A1H7G079_9BURK|nr:NAD-dependent succinate-semialdehyde dehydrogenase [Paraburkholderia caballeronis]PXW24814.1 succinate-semialdehyde dehydrogenase/glutarate-semialdehyde dehydrogenase [Paraburkholderia caballeronis]PXX00544.1 succinate-semialdehyde dehydrogenase/glutarate-semialdehyde dehydrogenase [Paraburkholderia caballeronis]RAJ98607.1 succinate-semialdehyde dehydrogenase/glutarate-semialdehyde dehydrogenase [Paraburkholderia caballeronis]TDV35771.1 succinate-semialdehyde dehydrogenase/glutarate-semialde
MYHQTALYIDGEWCQGSEGVASDVFNPATGDVIGQVPHASKADLQRAVDASVRAFGQWRHVPANDRVKVLRKAGDLLRERADSIAKLMTLEQGKPLAEARAELLFAPEHIDWCADESRRLYGRIVPGRAPNVRQLVVREPVGPVAAFSPWNFPVSQMIRKIAGALATGCTITIKAPEETPASCMEAVRCFEDAGVPRGALNLVFGVPADISSFLIPAPGIRKVSFTGSVPVGKKLAALAAEHMKRCTMELGGHAPLIAFGDVDPVWVADVSAAVKFRNAGQVCISPTRFYIHESIHDAFVERFAAIASSLRVGDGLSPDTQMGPLANARRVQAMERLVADAVSRGARVVAGGKRPPGNGYFYEPTVLVDVPEDAAIMNEEPFGPVVPVARFKTFDEVVARSNRLPFGLASYAFTRSLETTAALSERIEAGMLSVNGALLTSPETPFGGIKDSGFGSEGGIEGMESYLTTKLISEIRIGGRQSELGGA